jgi:hypothetical protein
MTVVEFETISWLINQTTTVCDPQKKQSFMVQLEHHENHIGFIRSLVRLLDLQDLGGQTQWEDRQLAAILLKNTVLKIIQHEESRKSFQEEINLVKSFLLRSFGEPQHQVFLQLHTLTAKLARIYWPNDWNELIPSIMVVIQDESKSFMNSFEATVCLHEILIELQCKSTCCSFHKTFTELCMKLFCAISKSWALRMKTMQAYISSFTNAAPSDPSLPLNYQFPRDENQEVNIFYAMIMSKILKILIETSFMEIMKQFSCFPCLWKTYMGSIQIVTSFIRKIRPHFIQILGEISKSTTAASSSSGSRLQCPSMTAAGYNSQQPITVCVLEKFYSLDLDDFNHATDYFYFPAHQIHQFPQYKGLFIVINLGMKLLKIMNCLPVRLQKKYPIESTSLIKDLMQFYSKFITDEISTDINQNQHLSILPLTCVAHAGILYLGNVLTCTAYQNYAQYKTQLLNSHHNHLLERPSGDYMDEVSIQSSTTLASETVREFFEPQRTKDLFERLLAYTMHYNENTLLVWYDTPEKFFMDENSEGMDYSFLRISSESLFVALLNIQPTVILPILTNLLQDLPRQTIVTTSNNNNNNINNEILLWDAIYTCAGLAVEPLSNNLGVSPTDWLIGIIGPLFHNLLQSNTCGALKPHGQQILRSRMLKLISSWIAQFDVKVHSTILQFLISLLSLSSQSDVVVQLSTVKTLSSLINTKDFDHQSLIPVVIPCIQALMTLIKQLTESENQKIVLELMKDVIEIVGIQLSSSALKVQMKEISNTIVEQLIQLWKSLSSEDVIRCTLIEVFTSAVNTFKGDFIHSKSLITLSSIVNDCLSNIYCPVNYSSCQVKKETTVNHSHFPPCHLKFKHSSNEMDPLQNQKNSVSCSDESFLTLESLLLLSCLSRNLPKQTPHEDPMLFEALVKVFNSISLHVVFSNENIFTTFGETNGKLILERICYFLEGFATSFPVLFFQDSRIISNLLKELLLKLFASLPAKDFYPLLRMIEIFIFIAPSQIMNLLSESSCLMIIFKCCACNATCPNLANLLTVYQGGQQVSLAALNILLHLLTINPILLMAVIQTMKEEILVYLFQTRGITQSNLTENVLVSEFICILVKAIPYLESSASFSCPLRLRSYCLGLWSFIAPTKNNSTDHNQTRDELFVPSLLSQEELQKWLPDILRITALYLKKCEELFQTHTTTEIPDKEKTQEWKSVLYSHCVSLMSGPFPMKDGHEFRWPTMSADDNLTMHHVNGTDLYEKLFKALQTNEQKFHSFFEDILRRNYQPQSEQQQQEANQSNTAQQEPTEREELILQAFFEFLNNNYSSQQISFDIYFYERCQTVINVFGRENFYFLLNTAFN